MTSMIVNSLFYLCLSFSSWKNSVRLIKLAINLFGYSRLYRVILMLVSIITSINKFCCIKSRFGSTITILSFKCCWRNFRKKHHLAVIRELLRLCRSCNITSIGTICVMMSRSLLLCVTHAFRLSMKLNIMLYFNLYLFHWSCSLTCPWISLLVCHFF